METLWLSRDGAGVKVELKELIPQHQLDGIRFLFRQYKLKHPGVILNDPSGYGKRLQVALFLNAVCPLLKVSRRPALILCEESDLENWTRHFEQWTSCRNDVTLNSPTPITKDTIFVNPHKDYPAFTRREWGVLVICSNVAAKELLQANLKADFKVWVTNVDIKENLSIFPPIYKWLYPTEKFALEDFEPKNNDIREVLDKKIILDAFLEDIVLRRNSFNELFDVSEKPKPESPKKSLKNKDVTGTKVKRSKKRKIDEKHASSSSIAPNDENQNYDSVSNGDIITCTDANIRHKSKGLRSFNTDYLQDVVNESGDVNNENTNALFRFEPENKELEKVIVDNDNGLPMEVNDIDNESIKSFTQRTANENESVTQKTVTEKGNVAQNTETDKENVTQHTTEKEVAQNTETDKKGVAHNTEIEKESVAHNTETKKANTETEKKSAIQKIDTSSDVESMQFETAINDIIHNENHAQSPVTTNDDVKCANNASKSTNKVENSVMKSLKDLDQSLLQCENEAKQRYKGSFFDSLFQK